MGKQRLTAVTQNAKSSRPQGQVQQNIADFSNLTKTKFITVMQLSTLAAVEEVLAEQNLLMTRAANKARAAKIAQATRDNTATKFTIDKPLNLNRSQVLEMLVLKGLAAHKAKTSGE